MTVLSYVVKHTWSGREQKNDNEWYISYPFTAFSEWLEDLLAQSWMRKIPLKFKHNFMHIATSTKIIWRIFTTRVWYQEYFSNIAASDSVT